MPSCTDLAACVSPLRWCFSRKVFRNLAKLCWTTIRSVLPRCHEKDSFKPRHEAICLILLRLQHASLSFSDRHLATRAALIFNELYGSDVVSGYEAAYGFACPPAPSKKPIFVDDEQLLVHQKIVAHLKLTRIQRSHSIEPSDLKLGD